MIKLPAHKLEQLRNQLQARGQRHSMVRPSASPNVLQAMEMLEQYGDMCDVMYLMMAADGRVLNVEREVMRGALDILSDGRIRTVHMEAMIDLCSRRVAEHGAEKSLQRAIKMLRDDPVRAETAVVLAAAVAAADAAIILNKSRREPPWVADCPFMADTSRKKTQVEISHLKQLWRPSAPNTPLSLPL